MKTKVLRFANGSVAVTNGLGVRINKQYPILEEEIKTDKDSVDIIYRNPKRFRFSKKAKIFNKTDYLSKHSR